MFKSQNKQRVKNPHDPTDHSASLVEIADQLGDPPFGRFHRHLDLSFNIVVTLEQKARITRFSDLPNGFSDSQIFLSSFFQLPLTHQHPQLKILLVLKQTQVQPFKKGISNSATQDSIMNAQNMTQFTYAKIKCTLKDSSCDSPISKNLMLSMLASNASLSSTKVFKCPHIRNDSIFTQWFTI
ncbi:hypothetical protein H5410_036459 [Solanum commersonii]|uniref:Uncharacterized protein n=1 Tax=Solanum commersonii TaxID=4109 RepID=A0A9J5Y3L1_SOLCO|nr:hypothetical protein H5410_036459 [Solanum commersonii]